MFRCFLGACFLILAAAGSANTVLFRTQGIRAEGEVAEIRLEKRYHATNFKHSTDRYRVRMEYMDRWGKTRSQWISVDPEEKKLYQLAEGAKAPFIYLPGGRKGMIGSEPPGWAELIVWDAISIPAGLLLIGWAIVKYRTF